MAMCAVREQTAPFRPQKKSCHGGWRSVAGIRHERDGGYSHSGFDLKSQRRFPVVQLAAGVHVYVQIRDTELRRRRRELVAAADEIPDTP